MRVGHISPRLLNPAGTQGGGRRAKHFSQTPAGTFERYLFITGLGRDQFLLLR